ncbi:MAG TPA: hypothetical protein VN947_22785 [Polyangia bacterium]|nr:hypothetical protein [Polyangia bacterium]
MDDLDLIAAYARRLEAALRRAGRPVQPLVDETTAHLVEDAARIARADGCSAQDAARRAIARFGDVPAVVAAARKNGRALSASIARVSSLVLLACVAWWIFTALVDPPYPLQVKDALIVNFFAELAFVSILLFRALDGRRTLRGVVGPALVLNGALAFALVVVGLVSGGVVERASGHGTPLSSLLADPVWALMLVQSIAGLRALGGTRTRDGALVAG